MIFSDSKTDLTIIINFGSQNLLTKLFSIYFLQINMKDKRDKYPQEFSPQKNSTSIPSSHSYTFKKRVRRTLGSEQDLDDKLTLTNIETNRIFPFYSPSKYKNQAPDIKTVIEQNQKLKNQIKTLKEILLESSKLSRKNQLTDSIRLKKDQKAQQIQKLKKIIERSYYSIKQMQDEIIKINEKLMTASRNCLILQKKNKSLECQKQELERKIGSITANHKQEIDNLYQRIHKLQMWTQMLNKMIEQDRKNWSSQAYELNNLKKFYSERRASG